MAPRSMQSGLKLRAVLIPVYIPTLILCICSAALVRDVLPVIGLIPCTISFVYGAAVVIPAWRKRHQHDEDDDEEHVRSWPLTKRNYSLLNSNFLALLVDCFIASTLLIVLCCTWTLAPWVNGYHGGQGIIVLATHTTVPMIFEFFAHTWLALLDVRDIYKDICHKRNTPAECPNCHARFHNSTSRINMTQGDRVEDYTINRPSEEVPFRDTSFDSDAAIGPDRHETATTGSKDS